MLAHVVLWINAFPPSSEVSTSYSPRTIMTGTAIDFNKHCQIPFRAYAEVHEDRNITNTMGARTQPAFCLGPTANFEGSYNFLSLQTGKRTTRKQFKELPMPSSIIKRVEAMATKEKQEKPLLSMTGRGHRSQICTTAITRKRMRLPQEWRMVMRRLPTRQRLPTRHPASQSRNITMMMIQL
jgi:hypothetical protein